MRLLDDLIKKGKRAIKREFDAELKKWGLGSDTTRSRSTRKKSSSGRRPATRTGKRLPVDDGLWLRPDQTLPVHGFYVGPWVYVGSQLTRQFGQGNEPSLINPQLTVREGRSTSSPKKPDYAKLTPVQRYMYLQWLNSGRREPAYAWIVQLFLYGLERRVINELMVNAGTRAGLEELREIARELTALHQIYGDTIGKAMANLSDTVMVLRMRAGDTPDASDAVRTSGIVLDLLLAQSAVYERPLRAELAWAWATANIRSTVISRHPAKAEQLFRTRFASSLESSIYLQPKAAGVFTHAIKSGNPAIINTEIRLDNFPMWDDPDHGLARIEALVKEIASDLGPYDRASRKEGFNPATLQNLALLPPGLLDATSAELVEFRTWLEQTITKPYGTVVPASSILEQFGITAAKPTSAEHEQIATMLERLGFGIQPDKRVGGDSIWSGERVVLFRMPQPLPTPASAELDRDLFQLQLAAAVAMMDGHMSQPELTAITDFIHNARLHPSERAHLYARLIFISLTSPVKITGLNRYIQELDSTQIDEIAAFLVDLAACEGSVSPEEMTVLGKVWKLLGKDQSQLSSALHQAMTSTSMHNGSGLSEELVARTQQETEMISGLLGDIFRDDEADDHPEESPSRNVIGNLSAAQSALLREVMDEESISMAEFRQLAESHGTMPGGALDAINQYALDMCGEPLLEQDGDVLVLNTYARDQMTVTE